MSFPRRGLPFLDAAEADAVVDQILQLRPHWTQRHPQAPFFTLGAASYLDRGADYAPARDASSALLREAFGALQQRLARSLEAELGMPVLQHERLAPPGFHVFLAHPAFLQPIGSVHFDLQFEHIDWAAIGTVDTDQTLSLTVMLRAPACGAAIEFWDLHHADIDDPARPLKDYIADRQAQTWHYTPGELLLHSGLQLHRIAPLTDIRMDDMRVSIQAHLIRRPDDWLLYW